MRVLIAPDKFKDALDAPAVAQAIADGVRDACPDAEVTAFPMADGGEGTGPLLAESLRAATHLVTALDPLGRACEARWWRLPGAATAIIEMAEASGMRHLRRDERNALVTTTFGTGQLIRAVLDAGCRRVLVAVGGSATVDGGAGCLQALGWRFVARDGREIPPERPITGGMLRGIARIMPPRHRPTASIDVLCDVDHPLVGPSGAARVFGPQKVQDPGDVPILERGLEHWAHLLHEACGRDVARVPHGGAAGGLPAGLHAAFGARLCCGFDEIASLVGLDKVLSESDLCLTGEGRLDAQTTGGKLVAGLARAAARHGVPVVALAGEVLLAEGRSAADLAMALQLDEAVQITPPGVSLEQALRETAANLRTAARNLMLHRRGRETNVR